jgi:two-component system LytT family response regulator
VSVLQVLIADDELLARQRLTRLLGALPEVALCGEAADGEAVLARVAQGGVDVVLLDIHMPGLSGLDAMALLPADGPYVIFCTAQPEHAVRAFDEGAVDYLLKPIEAGRLQKALERARSRDAQRRFQQDLARHRGPTLPALDRLAVSTRQGIVLIDPAAVTHAVLEDELVTVFTETERYLTDATLQELHERLAPHGVERVHRRALLAVGKVSRLEPLETGGMLARLPSGQTVEISRQASRELRKRLGLRRAVEDEGPG